jgi:heme oxygenase
MQTARLHKRVESLLGLPGAIRTQDEYSVWLARFLGLYDPIERSRATFSQWEALGIVPPHTDCLADDLVARGVGPGAAPRPPPTMQPDLPTFAHALGALYVLQGSTLGSCFILRDLETRIGAQIAGATRFLGDRGEAVGPMWQSFKAALDNFGRENPDLCADVVTGAKRVFRAILAWFQPLAARTEP